MTTKKLTKLLALYLPYILLGLVATNFGEARRLAEGYYVLMNFESKPEFPAELERVMKITEGVMRCLTTAVEA